MSGAKGAPLIKNFDNKETPLEPREAVTIQCLKKERMGDAG